MYYPKYAWAAPFAEIPPEGFTAKAMRAILGTTCTWWCDRRYWAQNINRHPPTVMTLRSFRPARRCLFSGSQVLWSSLEQNAARLECDITVLDPVCGIWLRPSPHADQRFLECASRAAARSKWPEVLGIGPKPEGAIDATSPEGLHALRTAARAQLLRQRDKRARGDEGGMTDIDVEAASQHFWKEFVNTLSEPQNPRKPPSVSGGAEPFGPPPDATGALGKRAISEDAPRRQSPQSFSPVLGKAPAPKWERTL